MVEINPAIALYATGGTHIKLRDILGNLASERLTAVSEYTGQPEMEGGLVKTLDYKIYLGILGETYNEAHREDLERAGAIRFDMVVVNLYPFEESAARKDVTIEEARANIDIGGPSMLRGAAKNFLRIVPLCAPSDYSVILDDMKDNGGRVPFARRFSLAKKAFVHTAEYEAAIVGYLDEVSPAKAMEGYEIQSRGPGE